VYFANYTWAKKHAHPTGNSYYDLFIICGKIFFYMFSLTAPAENIF
jgi:hypothetical protein